jgi:hypothetical protein
MRPLARRSDRGSAVVETILALPFLLGFMLAILEFSVVLKSGHHALRAARHDAWARERKADDAGYRAVPTVETTRRVHFAGRGAAPRTTSSAVRLTVPVLGDGIVTSLLRGVTQMGRFFSAVGLGPPQSAYDFLGGSVEGTQTVVTQAQDMRFVPGAFPARAHHVVALRTARAGNPSDTPGWFDPFNVFWPTLAGYFVIK